MTKEDNTFPFIFKFQVPYTKLFDLADGNPWRKDVVEKIRNKTKLMRWRMLLQEHIEIRIIANLTRKRGLMGVEKPIIMAIKEAGVIGNESMIDKITVIRAKSVNGRPLASGYAELKLQKLFTRKLKR